MSSGFCGSATRGMTELDREIEYRLGDAKTPFKRMDVFTDDFSPPGTAEASPGQDYRKPSGPYQDKHTDAPARSEDGFVRDPLPGNAKDQKEYDAIDATQQGNYGDNVKKPKDQYPGAKMSEQKIDGPESFHKAMERRLAKGGVCNYSDFDAARMKRFCQKDRGMKFMVEDLHKRNPSQPEDWALKVIFNSEVVGDTPISHEYWDA